MPTEQAPHPLYDTSFLQRTLVDNDVYTTIAEKTDQRSLVESFRIPIRSGEAWTVKAGQVCRIVGSEGPQVADFNCWNATNPRERFWASRTRQIHAAHARRFDRLWSCLPYLRPMLTVTNESLKYGTDEFGGRCHDLLGSRCDPYMRSLLTGEDVDHHCHSNLVRAVQPFGLGEQDVHDVLNLFTITGLVDDRYYIKDHCPMQSGDFFEFMAEIDVLCALSTCPAGDLSRPRWGPGRVDNVDGCRPLDVEVYDVAPSLLDSWTPPAVAPYRGNHGLAQTDA